MARRRLTTALTAALCLPSLHAYTPSSTLRSHGREVSALASSSDDGVCVRLSDSLNVGPPGARAFTSRRGALSNAALVAALAAAQPATAAGPLGGLASALGLGGSATPFGPVPKQGTTLPSGVATYDYVVGSGPTPNYGQVVRFEWVGYTRASADAPLVKFDSTLDRGTGPLLVKHGSGRVVQGLDEAIHSTPVGSRTRVVIPPRLGYTKMGFYGPVPPDAFKRRAWAKELDQMDATGAVVFDIALVEAYDDDADRGYYVDREFSLDEMLEIQKRVELMKTMAPK